MSVVKFMNRIELNKEDIIFAIKNSVSAAQAAKRLGVSPQTFSRRAKEYGIYFANQGLKGVSKPRSANRDERKYHCDDFAFDNLTEESAYWLGFILADGCIRKKKNMLCIVLKREDKEHLESFKKFLNFTGPIIDRVRVVNEIEYPISEITICSRNIIDILVNKYNITERKSYKEINTMYLIPKNLIIYFIIGFFDGDGNISKLDGYSSITSRDKNIIYFIQKYLEDVYAITSRVSFKEKKNVYYLTITKKLDAYKFVKLYLNIGNVVILLKRKKQIAEKYLKYNGLE